MKLHFKKIILMLATGIIGSQTISAQDIVRKFDFGSGAVHSGFTEVNAQSVYTPENGFGIVSASPVKAETGEGECNLTNDWVTSDAPFYFKIDLPEGRYRITVTLGNSEEATATTVKAESRRLMLENIETPKGEVITKTFVVDLRTPRINDTLEVHRKAREMTYLNWDNSLTLEFNGPKPCVSSIVIESANGLRAIFLAGDSTVTDQENEPWASWGQMFPRFLKPEIVVCNYAESGETLKAFRRANRLEKIISVMKPGDYLFIEFAHNDQKPGGNHVDPFTTYQEQIRFYMNEARKKGGIPVLVTSTARRAFDENGKIKKTLLEYPDAMRQLAKEENVALVDLNAMTKVLYETLGVANSTHAFVHYPANTFPGQDKPLADNTHFNPYGAYELAKCVVQSIIDQKLELANYVVDDFAGFDPATPDDFENFFWPLSPAADVIKPDGN
ncbi:rhamnogalacturonan acetylesterase [Mangrovibacterium marinum]|uniref:Lysophospholipase L1-like esterase n=1 Tax=Mangrovibacterium marinum TaxID=1639118 RepID=A0A2T5C6C7_9BACT|nr:rhamnogalacturonan acetylesterase [Mangrovibacterium marinum]PTN10452.1 lysophospholipase L1-like esterase [Mangrovibacterium marinum]